MAANVTLDMLNNYNGIKTVFSQQSQSISGNYSVIRATVTQYSTAWSSWGSTSTVTIKVDGQSQNINVPTWNWSGANSRSLGYRDFTVYHNADGKKSAAISQYWNHNWGGTKTGTFNMDTIPRASSIGTISGNTIGSPITVNISRASSSFTHQVWYRLPGQGWQNLGTGFTTSATFTIPVASSSYIKNSTSGNCEISIQTKSGSTNIGGSVSKNHTVHVPGSVVPSFTSLTYSETISTASSLGAYIQTVSRPKFVINGASGIHGSTISSYKITFDGQTINASSGTVAAIRGSGDLTALATITDSRGRSASRSVVLNVLPYKTPSVSNVVIRRSNSSGVEEPLGTHAHVASKITGTSIKVDGVEKNSITYVVRSKQVGTSTWRQEYSGDIALAYDSSRTFANFNIDFSYDFEIIATDKLTSVTVRGTMASGKVTMQIMDETVSIGGLVTEDKFNLYVDEKGFKSKGPIEDKNGNEVFGAADRVVERDSNSNGTWEKWASGKLVQWGISRVDSGPGTSRTPQTFPIPFKTGSTSANIHILQSIETGAPQNRRIGYTGVSATGFSNAIYYEGTVNYFLISWTATGVWK